MQLCIIKIITLEFLKFEFYLIFTILKLVNMRNLRLIFRYFIVKFCNLSERHFPII